MPVKTTFYLFQRIRDRLYLTPPSLDEHTSSTSAYLGALGFTKPQEKIVLCSIPLKNVLEWLAKPKGPHLVEDPMGSVPEKALVLAATKRMLYTEDPPSVGVGLVYKPHYVSMESFCRAYMHLNVWHATATDQDSTDKLDSSRFILVSISEASEVVPDVLPHPLFLDVVNKEAVGPPLILGFQAPYRVEPATWGGARLSDRFPSPSRGYHCTHVEACTGKAPSEPAAGA